MYNFFVDKKSDDGSYFIEGSDFNHIKNVLRMQMGEELLVSCEGKSHLCVIEEFYEDSARLKVVEEDYQSTELGCDIYLFQGLPKSDKLELIIQKCVELGVAAIVPVEMNRCVVKLDEKKKKSKTQRWQAIAESGAKQSKRNTVPKVFEAISYKKAMEMAGEMDLFLVPYENEKGIVATKQALSEIKRGMKIGILIGPEGGFEENEVALAKEAGGVPVSLGKRILRTETAAITAVGMCMLHIEMNVEDK